MRLNMRLLLITALAATIAAPVMAFENRSTPWVNPGFMALNCAPPLDRTEANPVVRIRVAMSFQDNSDALRSMDVFHEFHNMSQVDRSTQYRGDRLWQEPGRTDWYWTGTLIRTPAITMTGRAWRDLNDKWWYQETLHKNGVVTWRNRALCQVEEGH